GSAEELAEDLRRFQQGEPIRARPVSLAERALKWVRRRPNVSALAGILVVVLAGSFALGAHQLQTTTQALYDKSQALFDKSQALEKSQASEAATIVALARAYWEANRLDKAREYLGQCPSKYRNAAWDWVHYLCHAELRRIDVRKHTKGDPQVLLWAAGGRELI